MSTSIFLHIYYEDSFTEIFDQISHLQSEKNHLFVNVTANNPNFDKIKQKAELTFPKVIITKSSNVGKDIGAKLLLLELYLKSKIRSDLLLFLHDKKSPQLVDGQKWQSALYEILSPSKLNTVSQLFTNPSIGMVGCHEQLINKDNKSFDEVFAGNDKLVFKLAEQYGLKSKNHAFIGGTMFWVREEIFRNFFTKNSPLFIRSALEKGNVMDDFGPTVTHSWERLFGWIITTFGYSIKGI